MYKLFDDFKTYDSNLQPYSFTCERHTHVDDLHASVEERGFNLRSFGNRFILNTPKLCSFALETCFSYTFMEEINPVVDIYFGYDRGRRLGTGIRLEYELSGSMIVSLLSLEKMKQSIRSTVTLENYHIEEGEIVELTLKLEGSLLSGRIGDRSFEFNTEVTKGYIAIERKNFIGEFIIRSISVASDDEISEEIIIPEKTVEIPLTDGGDIPYLFSYKIVRADDTYYLDTKLFGGTASRKLNREDRPGQYVVELDALKSPFAVLRNGKKELRFNIWCGKKVVCDPNIFWECQRRFFGHPELPICNRFVLDNFEITDSTTISYGYESMMCKGYYNQAGGPSEHIFTLGGELVYTGDALGESIIDLYSPEDKYAISLIPKDAYEYDLIVKHLKGNHYFHIDENIKFTLSFKTKLNFNAFRFETEIRDVYDTETLCTGKCNLEVSDFDFGYKRLDAGAEFGILPLGVYKIVYNIYYGDSLYKRYVKAFEVFDKDSDISPAMASGLPFLFSMPNDQKWLATNTFDLWNPKPSCDEQHYISCVTNTPIEAERQRVWEVIKPFGREWFAWLEAKTCKDPDMEKHMDVVKNTDYLYVPARTEAYPLRNDLYRINTYQDPKFREYLHEFLNGNHEIADKVLYKVPEEDSGEFVRLQVNDETGKLPEFRAFTYEHLRDLMQKCHKEWMNFANDKILEAYREQNEFLKGLNPKFKRSCYGPFPQYVLPAVSYHSIKAYANLPYDTLAEDLFTGFCVFEDYPSACAYQTYRGAFAVMTIQLYSPKLRIYPELYKNSNPGGCIDGAVKFAHAPMGKYEVPLYYNTTHSLEYVYNTPQRTEEGYKYWTNYGFHKPDHLPELWDEEVRGWKTAINIKPQKPLRTMAMATEYFDEEDVYSDEIISMHGSTNLTNTSEEAHGYIYECTRRHGYNAPFVLKLSTLKSLKAEECDVLVLPTMRYVSDDIRNEVRRLYKEGVSLIAVSHVDGLEDIFGVRETEKTQEVFSLEYNGESEYIYPFDVKFNYAPEGAEVTLTAGGAPVIMKNDRAVLVNAPIGKLGFGCFVGASGKQRKNISRLFDVAMADAIGELSDPLVHGENVGVTLFQSQKGTKQLLCIDYSEYLNVQEEKKIAVVKLCADIKKVSGDRDITRVYDENGNIIEIRFVIRTHESVMFKVE